MNKKQIKFESEILDVIELTKNVKHLKLSVPNEFDFIPGQYISIILDKKIRRPYSIASPNNKNYSDNNPANYHQ